MPTFRDFYFNSSTGKNKIHARMCVPDAEPRAIVQIIHGIAEYIDRYDGFMSFLADNGIIMSGGGSMIFGMDTLVENSTGISTMLVDDPIACTVHGAGKMLGRLDYMQDGMMNFLRNREMKN